MTNWQAVFNRCFKLIDSEGPSYYSGTRFIRAVQEVEPGMPDYDDFIEQRRREQKSTTRRKWYKDLFFELQEGKRFLFVSNILKENESAAPVLCNEIRNLA